MKFLKSSLIGFSLLLLLVSIRAQSSEPIVVQAASQAVSAASPLPATPAAASDSSGALLKSLEEIKAKNAETLQKQQATLQQLDELQQAAEQLRIYAKRG